MGLMMCSIIGVGGEGDNSNYTKYYSEEDGYIHYDEIDQHFEEDMAIAPCMIKAVVRQTEENRGSKVYTDGEFLI
jgi:pentose-5-phosphate-3-epimerase